MQVTIANKQTQHNKENTMASKTHQQSSTATDMIVLPDNISHKSTNGTCTFQICVASKLQSVFLSQSLNGVWVNGNRIHAEKAHQLRLGDSIRLGVPVSGTKVEFDYILVQRPLKDIKPCLAKGQREGARAAHISKKPKRKLPVEEVEPSTSKPKLYRLSSSDKSFAKPCPLSPVRHQAKLSPSEPETTGPIRQDQEVEQASNGCSDLCDLDNLQM